jgi:KDO2-lipid IV(A) lauroyltransferase
VIRTRRGHYEIKGILLENDPAESKEGEITRKYVAELEAVIREHPESYLWSHKRWKHPWKEEYSKLWIGDSPSPAYRTGEPKPTVNTVGEQQSAKLLSNPI